MRRLVGTVLLVWLCSGVLAARAEQPSPRDLWPEATAAADAGDVNAAAKRTNTLMEVGRSYGIRTFPLYADSAADLHLQALQAGNGKVADWADKAADQLDPSSSTVAFKRADLAASHGTWGTALPAALRGFTNLWQSYRSRLLSHSDLMIVVLFAIVVTAAIFSISLFVRYGRLMAHDFREIVGKRLHGGSVSVLAFALLFAPIFLWLGPAWLLLYWLILFFGYAGAAERFLIILLALAVALVPIALDAIAHQVAGVESSVVMADLSTREKMYQPEALPRLQELVGIVSDDANLHLLLGNLQLQEGREPAAAAEYRRANELHESAGAHVNIGNLHFLDNDFPAAITEYERAEQLDPKLAIAFYNHSLASGEVYRFDEQGRMIEQAKRLDSSIERYLASPPAQKVVMYNPPLSTAWTIANAIAHRGAARSLFGNYSVFDPDVSALNPLTIGGILTVILAPAIWVRRRRNGFAGACIKCGRTFCHRCKSARESATYCTQCIHIYLKRDGVSLDTKRAKLDEVQEHHSSVRRRDRLFGTFLPGSGQILQGRAVAGTVGLFLFSWFVITAVLTGRLAPVLTSRTAQELVIAVSIAAAVVTWLLLMVPVWRRRAAA
jgi:tetratricopeptide (TPR) repeat protein